MQWKPRRVSIIAPGAEPRRCPAREAGAELVLINTAGGLTGGDHVAAHVTANSRARVTVTTPGCERIYRSLAGKAGNPDVQPGIDISIGAGTEVFAGEGKIAIARAIALAAGASVSNMPIAAVLSLPVLFAAGMSVMDTTDGVLMSKAYHWAFINPARKLLYNLTTTSLGVLVALVIGTLELAGVLVTLLGLRGGIFDTLRDLDLGSLGYVLVALFLIAWGGSYAWWKWHGGGVAVSPCADVHTHADGVTHIHRRYR